MANKEVVEITPSAIRKFLTRYNPESAISEYIWNGFDANAKHIYINFKEKEHSLGLYESVSIIDDGDGICYEELAYKFKKFNESQKKSSKTTNLIKGKNGYGRFTFFKFANYADWSTAYEKADKLCKYNISIKNETLNDYTPTEPEFALMGQKGTTVIFREIQNDISPEFIENILKPYLQSTFAWFLELNSEFKIFIDNKELEYDNMMSDSQNVDICANGKDFKCKYIQWSTKLEDQYSHFYFLNEKNKLKIKKTTLLNKKGDGFWHSVIVRDDFFDTAIEYADIDESSDNTNSEMPSDLFSNPNDRKTYKELVGQLNDYLKQKRKPFLKGQAEILIDQYEKEGVMPNFGSEAWDTLRKKSLSDLVKGLYEAEPAIFMRLNKSQKRVLLELFNLIMTINEKDSLFKILESVVDLDSEDRKTFAKVLETTRLEYIISTITIIKDRLIALEGLKQLVFNHELKANERNHLQKFIEKHYWIFGEEYRLVCSEEVKFKEALGKYLYILRGVEEDVFMKHPDQYKEMDLFLAGTDFRDGKPHNVVVEIKNPSTIKKLTDKEVGQIKRYINVILSTDQFNSSMESWSFYLIGQDYDNIVKTDLQNHETGLLRKSDNHCLYVRRWSDVINEVERRLKYLLDKLKIERSSLITANTPVEVLNKVSNSASYN